MRRVVALLAEKPTPTEAQVAARIGKGQPYVSKLRLIAGLDASVVEKWEESWHGGVHVPVNDMRDLHVLTPADQREEYKRLVAKAALTKRQHREKLGQRRRR
jgi:hypothetical protein